MKSPPHPAPLALARLVLRQLQAWLGHWAPQPAPVWVPIPLRTEGQARAALARRGHRRA